jgi:hypothetical protein
MDKILCPNCQCSNYVYEIKSCMKNFRRFHCNNPITIENHSKIGRCQYWYIHNDLLIDNKLKYKPPYTNDVTGRMW